MPTNKQIYMKEYYATHYDKILANLMRKVICPCCDKEFFFSNMSRHRSTNKYKKNMLNKNEMKEKEDENLQKIETVLN